MRLGYITVTGHAKTRVRRGVKFKLRWFENVSQFCNVGWANVTLSKLNANKNCLQKFSRCEMCTEQGWFLSLLIATSSQWFVANTVAFAIRVSLILAKRIPENPVQQISWKFVQLFSRCNMRTDGRTTVIVTVKNIRRTKTFHGDRIYSAWLQVIAAVLIKISLPACDAVFPPSTKVPRLNVAAGRRSRVTSRRLESPNEW